MRPHEYIDPFSPCLWAGFRQQILCPVSPELPPKWSHNPLLNVWWVKSSLLHGANRIFDNLILSTSPNSCLPPPSSSQPALQHSLPQTCMWPNSSPSWGIKGHFLREALHGLSTQSALPMAPPRCCPVWFFLALLSIGNLYNSSEGLSPVRF